MSINLKTQDGGRRKMLKSPLGDPFGKGIHLLRGPSSYTWPTLGEGCSIDLFLPIFFFLILLIFRLQLGYNPLVSFCWFRFWISICWTKFNSLKIVLGILHAFFYLILSSTLYCRYYFLYFIDDFDLERWGSRSAWLWGFCSFPAPRWWRVG